MNNEIILKDETGNILVEIKDNELLAWQHGYQVDNGWFTVQLNLDSTALYLSTTRGSISIGLEAALVLNKYLSQLLQENKLLKEEY